MDLEILLDLPYRTLSDIKIPHDHLASALPLPFVSWFLSYDWIYPGASESVVKATSKGEWKKS
jgi:hypothetical protein